MKKVNFKTLKIQNFLSIGNEPVVIDFKPGINIITGINKDKEDRRNAIGKSTITDAFFFAIFGNTIRDIRRGFISNNITQEGCYVELEVEVDDPKFGKNNFIIKRGLSPSKCTIFKNGKEKTRDSIQNTNSYIHSVLSSTPEIFQNCVIMTLNNHIPFMSKGKTDKRKFIEQIFNLEVFSKMMSEIRLSYNEEKKNFDVEVARLEDITSHINAHKKQQTEFNNNKKRKIANIKEKITDINKNIQKILKEIDNIKQIDISKYNDALQKIDKNISEIIKKRNVINNNIIKYKTIIDTKQEELDQIDTGIGTICKKCRRPINEHDRSYIENEAKSLKSIIENNKTELREFVNQLELLIDKEKEIINTKNKINTKKNIDEKRKSEETHLQYQIKELRNSKTTLTENIDEIKNEKNSVSSIIKKMEEDYDNIKKNLDDVKNKLNLLDVVKFIVSEEGVKSYIVKKILQHFNSKLAYFLKRLDSNCVCMFNEYFEEEIVNEKGKICLYNNFSGAERKAIDLACLFSFMDVRRSQGDVHYNISFYDELFDTSLDEKGVELAVGILNERVEKYNESIMVISHRKESSKFATGGVIFLEKQNGITRKVDFHD